jgi:hypothetical protein
MFVHDQNLTMVVCCVRSTAAVAVHGFAIRQLRIALPGFKRAQMTPKPRRRGLRDLFQCTVLVEQIADPPPANDGSIRFHARR